jgi:hypothetical protein
MNHAINREKIIRELSVEARGSFTVIQKAMSDVSRVNGSNDLDVESVKTRIREIMHERTLHVVPAE